MILRLWLSLSSPGFRELFETNGWLGGRSEDSRGVREVDLRGEDVLMKEISGFF